MGSGHYSECDHCGKEWNECRNQCPGAVKAKDEERAKVRAARNKCMDYWERYMGLSENDPFWSMDDVYMDRLARLLDTMENP